MSVSELILCKSVSKSVMSRNSDPETDNSQCDTCALGGSSPVLSMALVQHSAWECPPVQDTDFDHISASIIVSSWEICIIFPSYTHLKKGGPTKSLKASVKIACWRLTSQGADILSLENACNGLLLQQVILILLQRQTALESGLIKIVPEPVDCHALSKMAQNTTVLIWWVSHLQ